MPGTTTTTPPPPPSLEAENSSEQPSEELLNIDKNEDYQSVLQALQVLKQQLTIATNDVQVLGTLKSEALEDPYTFIGNLRKKTSKSKMPKLQKVVAVPNINWNKYRFLPESRIVQQQAALNDLILQTKRSAYCNILDTSIEYTTNATTPVAAKNLQQELVRATQAMRQIPSRANSVSDFSEDDDDSDSAATKATPRSKTMPRSIRGIAPSSERRTVSGKGKGKRRTSTVQTGRDLQASSMDMSETESPVRSRLQSIEPRTPDEYTPVEANSDDPSRAPTFKQPWSDQEQERLQELLITFPDEPVQAQRFNKISKALGTRTPRQVASRVQKYFIKLAKMGLPVPGRITIPPSCMPKGDNGVKKMKTKAKPKNQGRISKPAAPPALRTTGVGYNSAISGGITNTRISGGHYANTTGPPAVYMSDDEEDSSVKEMMRNCDSCGAEPIVGVLYKCTMCDVSEEVDLCGNCMQKGTFTNDHHTLDHTFEAVRTANPLPYYADNDYKSPEHLGEYSYLGF
ncbi:hypothetical protein MAM1_0105c05383 [Mucor ambiguus]|uniref:ZZ-type domain-containing protein n=1 Tax=Mucor ambiguus TaxID=91626 RepID=A0A0C9MRI0_9FUNG|nr:hypothetical protein MAM1_0105c05383 [Mucor ambiguus]